jgi:hypothetical protein
VESLSEFDGTSSEQDFLNKQTLPVIRVADDDVVSSVESVAIAIASEARDDVEASLEER